MHKANPHAAVNEVAPRFQRRSYHTEIHFSILRYPQVQINFFERDVNAIYDYFLNADTQQNAIGFVQVPELEYQKPVE